MRKRIADSRAKTKQVQQQETRVCRDADRARELRDDFKAVLDDLKAIRKQARKNIEHMQLSKQRALRRAAVYAVQCDYELEGIDAARRLGELV